MLAVHNILYGTYAPWAVACHVICCQSCDRSLSVPWAVPTPWRLLQVLVLSAVQDAPDTTSPFYPDCGLCDLCLISSPDPGDQHCTHCSVGSSLAPYRMEIPGEAVFCAWLISLNIVSSEFILFSQIQYFFYDFVAICCVFMFLFLFFFLGRFSYSLIWLQTHKV